MKFTFLMSALLMLLAASTQAENQQIYKPVIVKNGLDNIDKIASRRGMLGIGYANVLPENASTSPRLNLNARYLAGDHWYWLGEIQLGVNENPELVVEGIRYREPEENVTRYAMGAGYAFLLGNASIRGVSLPWKMSAELLVGDQQTADSNGRYSSLGLTTQLMGKRMWGALGLRQYHIDDERLTLLGSNWGTQWDISIGFWF